MQSLLDVVRFGASAAVSVVLRRRVLNCLWELTYRCNAKCSICGYWKLPARPDQELTLPQIQEGLRRVHAYGCRLINFTGGEPTLRRDLADIIHSASQMGIWVSLVTNGSLLTRERLTELKHAGLDHLLVSLDSTEPGAHDRHRGIPGLHARVLNCLRWMAEDFLTGHRTGGIMCAVSSTNADQVRQVAELAGRYGVYAVLQPYHRKKTGDPTLETSLPGDLVRVVHAQTLRETTFLNSKAYVAGMVRFCEGQTMPRCLAGRKYFSVDPYGNVHPCVDTPAAGHLLRDDLSVLRSERALRAVEACSGCWYCFRGEADSALTMSGYWEKVRLGLAVFRRNLSRSRRRQSARLTSGVLAPTQVAPGPTMPKRLGLTARKATRSLAH